MRHIFRIVSLLEPIPSPPTLPDNSSRRGRREKRNGPQDTRQIDAIIVRRYVTRVMSVVTLQLYTGRAQMGDEGFRKALSRASAAIGKVKAHHGEVFDSEEYEI